MQEELIDQLEELFTENKNSHRSPIINLPEILMFKYDEDDLVKCGENFRECQFAKDDDPVNNTVRYYTDRFQDAFSQPALNKILEIIINNKYAIFHIDPVTIYMVSVDPNTDAKTKFCVDKLTIHLANSNSVCNNKELTSDKLDQLWKTENPPYDFNELSQYVHSLVNTKGYHMNKDIAALAKYNEDYMENLKLQPAYESIEYDYAMEANQGSAHFDIAGNVDAFLNESKLSTADKLVGDRLDVSQSNRTAPPPEEEQQQQAPQEGDPNQAPPPEGEQDPNQQQPQEGDPNQQPQEGEEQDPNAQYDDQQQEEPPQEEEPPPSPGEELLNDPEAKPKYRLKFVLLYKNVSDVIDTLESFTPEYNSPFVAKYYQIQTDLNKLKTAISKICTDRINKMDVTDVMNAYASANIVYDAICKMLDEFMKEYDREREKLVGKRQKIKEIKEKIQEKSFTSARQ